MARISKYEFDKEVTGDDFVIGTDHQSKKTRNFRLSDLTPYFAKQGAIQGNKFAYEYAQSLDYQNLTKGLLSFNNKSSVNTPLSGVSNIYINRINFEGHDIYNYLEELRANAATLYLFNGSNSTHFGIYRIQSLNIFSGDVIRLNVDVLSSNGTITQDDVAVISVLYSEGDKSHVHNQLTSQSTWYITHGLEKYPSVTVVDSGNNVVIGDIQYLNANQLTITFASALLGKAYVN